MRTFNTFIIGFIFMLVMTIAQGFSQPNGLQVWIMALFTVVMLFASVFAYRNRHQAFKPMTSYVWQ